MTEQRQSLYFDLIDKLISCPNGQEPEILEQDAELIDAGFVNTIVQVATVFAHEGNEDGAKFLIHIARELSQEMGLYPDVSDKIVS